MAMFWCEDLSRHEYTPRNLQNCENMMPQMAHREDFVLLLQRGVDTERFEIFSHYMSVFVFQVLSSFSSYMTARHKEMFSLQVSTQSLCEPMPSKSSKQSTNYTTGIVPRTYISQFILSPQPWKREGKKKSPCILETWKLKLIEFIFYIAPESFLQSWSVDNKASMW